MEYDIMGGQVNVDDLVMNRFTSSDLLIPQRPEINAPRQIKKIVTRPANQLWQEKPADNFAVIPVLSPMILFAIFLLVMVVASAHIGVAFLQEISQLLRTMRGDFKRELSTV